MENSGAFTRAEAPLRLWRPGLHAADLRVRLVARAVEQYDESLRLARHEVYGDWVVTIGENGHPVFGFGRELPDPAEVERLLGQHDIKRHGKKMMEQLARDAERKRKEAEHTASESTGIIAEQFEHAFRKQGAHPTPRIFVPRTW